MSIVETFLIVLSLTGALVVPGLLIAIALMVRGNPKANAASAG